MKKITLSILLIMFSMPVCAGDLWLQGGFFSKHISETKEEMREVNPGLGFQYDVNESVSVIGGQYLNSLSIGSDYFGSFIGYRSGVVKAGASVVLINGYPLMNNGNEFLGLVPTISVEGERLGFNVVFIPPIEGVVGVVAVQFKIKIN